MARGGRRILLILSLILYPKIYDNMPILFLGPFLEPYELFILLWYFVTCTVYILLIIYYNDTCMLEGH